MPVAKNGIVLGLLDEVGQNRVLGAWRCFREDGFVQRQLIERVEPFSLENRAQPRN